MKLKMFRKIIMPPTPTPNGRYHPAHPSLFLISATPKRID